jgi:hypothetical protein
MANQKLTDKTELAEQAGSGDLLMVVDVSDTSSSAQGTSKKMDFKYVIQTDKFSLNNTEVLALDSTSKTLVGALSGYMVTPISATVLVTHAGSNESSNKNLIFGWDDTQDVLYWDAGARFFGAVSGDRSYVFGGNQASAGAEDGSLLNKSFKMWASSTGFNGGWSCDVYLTYAYTKVL